MKKYYNIRLFLFLSILIHQSCTDPNSSVKPAQNKDTTQESKLQVGGLYIIQNNEGSYSILKILVIDSFAIHLRHYSNDFQKKPIDLSSDTLKILIGHSPLAMEGFLLENPELLKVEVVKEDELEGYKLYLKSMEVQ